MASFKKMTWLYHGRCYTSVNLKYFVKIGILIFIDLNNKQYFCDIMPAFILKKIKFKHESKKMIYVIYEKDMSKVFCKISYLKFFIELCS